MFLCCQCQKLVVGDRGKIFLSSRCQKVALGVDGEGKGTILDPIYLNFLSFKKGFLEQILASGSLQRAVYFHSNLYARLQVAATIATLSIWTLKISGSTTTYR